MNVSVLILLLVLLAGCSYQGQSLENYVYEPERIITDPHYSSYQEQSDALESEYLAKKITYADYLEKKSALDQKYTKEVHAREAIIHAGE